MEIQKVSTLAKRLSQALDERGLTVTALADQIGLSKQAISTYLTGQCFPSRLAMKALCEALEIDGSWLCGYDVPEFPASRSQDNPRVPLLPDAQEMNIPPITYQELELIFKFRRLSEQDRVIIANELTVLSHS